ncbi:unnamed protein product, partial [Rotaria socialis]
AGFISLTFDGCADRRVRAFYAITMHYVDQTGQLRAHLLAYNHISGKIAYLMKKIRKNEKWTKEVLSWDTIDKS